MGKLAFVFAGQGTQQVGMGQALALHDATAAHIFAAADALRPETSAQCFTGDEAVLRETVNTQPCLFAVEMAIARALSAHGVVADCVAGFSLGEVVALAYAEAADFETMFQLICKRGALMQAASEKQPTGMVAVVRLENEQVVAICNDFAEVYPVNFNCPGQVTVAGEEEALKAFSQAVKSAGGRTLPLKVKGGFHSPFMAEAADAFYEVLRAIPFKVPAVPVYANAIAMPYGEDIAVLLAKQLISPVQWEASIRQMIADGVDTFIEIGIGQTLSGMIKRIDDTVALYQVATPEDVEQVCKEVLVC